MKQVKEYEGKLLKCPHCKLLLNASYSSDSEKRVMNFFLYLLKQHKKDCIFYESPKIVEIEMKEREILPQTGALITTWSRPKILF